MFFNYVKVAFRTIRKNSVFSAINITGLALGIGAFIIIFRYIAFEFSFEDFHEQKDQVFALQFEKTTADNKETYVEVPSPMVSIIQQIPEVKTVTPFVNVSYQNFSVIAESEEGKRAFQETNIFYTDNTFAETFSFPASEGSFAKMNEPWKVVIHHEIAQKLYGTKSAIGKTITLSSNVSTNDYEIVGVLEPFPKNTHFRFRLLLSFPSVKLIEGEETYTSYENWNTNLFVKSTPEVKQAASLEEKLENHFISVNPFQRNQAELARWNLSLTPLTALHFSTYDDNLVANKGNKKILGVLAAIGFLILFIAWINYINLSTVRAMERAKEVGVRKVLGSSLSQLRMQFLAESLVMNAAAATLAFLFVQNTLPILSSYTNPLLISDNQQILFWGSVVGIIVFGALLSGIYPAFILSNYKPTDIISGKVKRKGGGELLRKSLVVFQYAASILLIGGALTISQQLTYMMNYDLGIDLEKMLVIKAPSGVLDSDNRAFFTKVKTFQEVLTQKPAISSVTSSSSVPGNSIGWKTNGVQRIADQSEETETFSLIALSETFFETYDFELLEGRFLNETDNPWANGRVVINELAAQQLGFRTPEEALGAKLTGGKMFSDGLTIVGVVKNHNHVSLKEEYDPVIYINSAWSNYYSVELNVNDNATPEGQMAELNAALAEIENEWKRFFPNNELSYYFADDAFSAQYQNDRSFRWIVSAFTLLAIIIATMGLLGLSSYTLLTRSKEMSIRKVLGASSTQLIQLLAKDYLTLIVIAGVLATPVTWFLLQNWLDNYAFRIEVSEWLLLSPIALIIFISAVTVGFQIMQSAKNNPVDSLRNG